MIWLSQVILMYREWLIIFVFVFNVSIDNKPKSHERFIISSEINIV